MREFTLRAVLIGLVLTIILGAANAYLGMRAGMTIAATYPAAVIGMAVLRIMRGSILEENIARTVGSIGESVAAGAIFTIPAFLLTGAWTKLDYFKSAALMFVGGFLGIMFVTFLRRVMVTDPDLAFPESVAAAEIHKAGQKGSSGAKFLFQAMGSGAIFYGLGMFQIVAASKEFIIKVGRLGSSFIRIGPAAESPQIATGGTVAVAGPGIFPAYLGVGYIIGPRLASLNFAGGILAWGLFAPLLVFFLGPELVAQIVGPGASAASVDWVDSVTNIWKFIIRPVAVGGMLVGASYTLYRMRKNLAAGIKRSLGDVKKAAGQASAESRLEKDLNIKLVLIGLVVAFILMIFVYRLFTDSFPPALMAAAVMAIAGFFFAAVSGNLVGTIGASNNPLSGLTLSTLIIAALLMVAIGVSGTEGLLAVLGVAAVVCVSSAVAGEMLQDLKVGYLLGGTPWKMQVSNLVGVLVASLVLYFPIMLLIKSFEIGSKELPAPQAGLMAVLAKGIVGGELAWPLVIVGMFMGLAFILIQVKSPMLVAVGMYLPLETTFAIFVGGMIKGIVDRLGAKRGHNAAQKARVDNVGILIAAGLIAGEGLTALLRALWIFLFKQGIIGFDIPKVFASPSYMAGLAVLALMAFYLIAVPLKNAGAADEPPPPSAVI
jgi:putative OPT family oligopeptide transporter